MSLTVHQVALRFGVRRRTVYRWIRRGVLPAFRTPLGRLRIAEIEVDRFQKTSLKWNKC